MSGIPCFTTDLNNQIKNNNEQLLQWSLSLQECNLEIEHIKGKENIMADALPQAM